jgi:hypothetical protein
MHILAYMHIIACSFFPVNYRAAVAPAAAEVMMRQLVPGMVAV